MCFPQQHEFDELRFDIRAHDCNYFLRASSVQERDSWVEAIEANKVRQSGEDSSSYRISSCVGGVGCLLLFCGFFIVKIVLHLYCPTS